MKLITPGESLIIEIEPEGVDTGDQDIDPQVKLEAVNQEGVLDVSLHTETGIRVRNIRELVNDLDPLAAGILGWLHNPQAVLL